MARPRDHAKHVTAAVEELLHAVTGLVGAVGSAVATNARASGGKAAVAVEKAASTKSAKLRKALKAYWSRMKGKARQQRIAVMLEGRGLKPRRRA